MWPGTVRTANPARRNETHAIAVGDGILDQAQRLTLYTVAALPSLLRLGAG